MTELHPNIRNSNDVLTEVQEFENYEFTWRGKRECIKLAQQKSDKILVPCANESLNFNTTQNLYVEGDNLDVLKILQESYSGKVKMIYIDPPYNTGNKFVYNDRFTAPRKTTKCQSEIYSQLHNNWLNMMYPRLLLAADFLRDDGVIFISIDVREIHNLRKICDEIFGEENFVQEIIWEKKCGIQNDAKYFSLNHEQILCYAKSKEKFKRNLLPMTKEQIARYKNPDNDPRGVWMPDSFFSPSYCSNDDYPITTPSGRVITPSSGNCWRFSKERYKQLICENRIYFGKNNDGAPRLKRFLHETQQGCVPISIFYCDEVGHTHSATQSLKKIFDNQKIFHYPKPVGLIKRLAEIATYKDSLVLDFFSGSATTAHAVMELNKEDGGHRQFIMVQLPEICDEKSEAYKAGYKNICEIGKERIRRAGAQLLDTHNNNLDVGFRVFKLENQQKQAEL